METWTTDEMKLILVAVSNDRYGALFYLQAMTGARRGELMGLRRFDVDLDEDVIWFLVNRVRLKRGYSEGTLKGDKGKKVTIDDATITLLATHRQPGCGQVEVKQVVS